MNLLDIIEFWVQSLRGLFASFNISVVFSRTDDDRPNHSCAVTLRRGNFEVDLLAWESGHGELAVTREPGDFSEEHLKDLCDKEVLATVLSGVLSEIFRD